MVLTTNYTAKVLCQKLGYQFKNLNLLEDALSHRSFRGKNNERQEFLGDAILSFVIAAALFQRCPNAKEGELSRLRSNLVCGETLATLAQEFELGNYLRLGAGEIKSGGSHRNSILADAMEAVVGAIYLDGGITICKETILRWYASRLENFSELPNLKDPKTRLQEYLQARRFPLPSYVILSIDGAAHEQIFHVKCAIEGLPNTATGTGNSRRRAEQEAARHLLNQLEHDGK